MKYGGKRERMLWNGLIWDSDSTSSQLCDLNTSQSQLSLNLLLKAEGNIYVSDTQCKLNEQQLCYLNDVWKEHLNINSLPSGRKLIRTIVGLSNIQQLQNIHRYQKNYTIYHNNLIQNLTNNLNAMSHNINSFYVRSE